MTFYFFDLETSGFSPREDRIMQFAGQRTDLNLNPIGEPDNILIRLTDDVLPSPEAILVTKITPQQTRTDGITEVEFCKYFIEEICVDNTVFVGFNNMRFDNDFIRFTLWRNFYDAYEWSWKNGCSTWDLLDVVRMTRALRPDGIKWAFASDGKPTNKLEFLTKVNNLDHANAHDALSDIKATISVAKMIKSKQARLFEFLLDHRSKQKVAPLVTSGKPFIYTSGRYPAEFEKTTIVTSIAQVSDRNASLVYDLRVDPESFKNKTPAELAELWQKRDEDYYFPVKQLAYNKCPAVAPLVVLDKTSQKRLGLRIEIIDNHFEKIMKIKDLGDRLLEAQEIIKKPYQQELVVDPYNVDGSLYDSFINDADKIKMRVVTASTKDNISELNLDFSDDRLEHLLPLYKARNYPKSLTTDEANEWESYRRMKLISGPVKKAEKYFERINELAASAGSNSEVSYLLEELRLYGESILPMS